jgi:2-methylcitrate dehydratase PrpD
VAKLCGGKPDSASHPSDNIASCLAVAEAECASARELITAIAIAYEVNCRLTDAVDTTARGWDPPVSAFRPWRSPRDD